MSSPFAHNQISEVYRSGLNPQGWENNSLQLTETSGRGLAYFDGKDRGPFGQSWKNNPPLPECELEDRTLCVLGLDVNKSAVGLLNLVGAYGTVLALMWQRHRMFNQDKSFRLRGHQLGMD